MTAKLTFYHCPLHCTLKHNYQGCSELKWTLRSVLMWYFPFSLVFKLRYSRFTMLCSFLLSSKVIQLSVHTNIYTYTFFFKIFFSSMVYHRTVSIVLCGCDIFLSAVNLSRPSSDAESVVLLRYQQKRYHHPGW